MTDTRIAKLHGRRVWDSRGRPTVEVEVHLADGAVGRAIAPAGASTGQGEAVDLRDGGSRFGGLDVRRAVGSVNTEIAPALLGLDAADQETLDRLLVNLDGTPDRGRLGGNAIVATSMAVLHAAAASAGVPLWRHLSAGRPVRIPLPEIQIFGGGAHADRRVDVQDFMVVCPAARSFSEALDWTAEIYRAAGSLMREAGKAQGVADEGGFWPAFDSNEEALETLTRAIETAGFTPAGQVGISLDVAASQFGGEGRYTLALDDRTLDTAALIDMLGDWIDQYPILSVEDPVGEDDHEGMVEFTRRFGHRCQVIGDDYLVTDAKRVEAAATGGAANAVLVKPNQAGTVTEAHQALRAGKDAGFGTVVSARSGETEDVTIAHLSVGWDAGQLKVGSFTRSERMAKWNEVLRIEEDLGDSAEFSGWSAFTFGDSGPATTKP
ncbi:phosphopyruvate hydratase [Streptomyces griseorubiginosus]|uniref:phosphopyruvate hydratase n=1 Tax=Streptomyces griseorubiginosus TaxID=67304 RepID=UPI002E802493|nr:phosphopyruvate hydratase [Streptomyces griseorubiginosus]WUB49680.1 phosphopyruvate hydratase [Streptomyces griseorubiginosus]WUB58209.1 phosphopyruvate hydratase [Streptomyces griseorubiginosus]